jgi:hypothetical protein
VYYHRVAQTEIDRRPLIGYARISDDDKKRGAGVERQKPKIEGAARRLDLSLLDIIVDNDRSASMYATKEREGWKRVLAVLDSGVVQGVALYNIDRLTRVPRETEDLIDRKALIADTGRALDTRDGDDRKILRDSVNDAAHESDKISRRVKLWHEDRAGKTFGGGPLPFGYQRERDYEPYGIMLNDAEADGIRRGRDFLRRGGSLTGVMREWQRRFPYRFWTVTQVKKVLLRPGNAGIATYKGAVTGTTDYPAIITPDDLAEIRGILDRGPRRVFGRKYLLTGALLRCGECGSRMRARRRGDKGNVDQFNYFCEAKSCVAIEVGQADAWVSERFLATVTDPELLAQLRQASNLAVDAEALQAELKAADVMLTDLATAHGDQLIDMAEWLAARKPVQERKVRAQKALGKLTVPISLPTGDTAVAQWEAADDDQKRAWLAGLFEYIIVNRARPGKDGSLPKGDRLVVEWLS